MSFKVSWIAVAALGLVLAGCETEPQPVVEPVAEEAVEKDPMITDHQTGPDLDASVAAARSNLAERLEIEEAEINVVDARRVTWRDGAMGCPEPDMMYTQALVEGFYIVLEANGERHAYHAGRDGRPFFCPADRSQAPAAGPSEY
jgi:hypothetical protein